MSRTSKRVTASYSAQGEVAIATATVGPRAVAAAPAAQGTDAAKTEAAKNGVVLSDSTSLDELFTAILGGDSRENDDRGPLLEAVDAQVSRLRKELGLVEPPPPPPPVKPPSPREFSFGGATSATASAGEQGEAPTRFRALSQAMPDVWSRIPRPVRLGLPVAGLLLAGGLWLGLADSRPRDVSAEVPAVAAAAPASTAAPSEPTTPSAALTSESTPPAPSATSTLSTPIPAPEPPPAVTSPDAGTRPALSRSTSSGARARTNGARPLESSPADVASPAAPNAATGGAPVAAGTPTASLAAAPTASLAAAPPPVASPPIAVALPPAAAVPDVAPAPAATSTGPATAPTVPAGTTPTAAATPAPSTPTAPSPAATAAPPSTAAAANGAPPASPVPAGGSQPAVLISRATPVYPEAARRNRVAGPVDLVLAIDRQGNVVRATAVEGNPLLRQAAEEAARKWRYRPEFANGVPIDTERRVRIVFQ